MCELERERGGILDEHRFAEEADERRVLLLEEERLRLIEEKELVRLMETERKAFLVDQRKAHEAEVKELVAQSENQLTHREDQEGRLEHAESTVRRLEQEVEELESMIKKVGLDQDAMYQEPCSSDDGLIQTEREETDPAMHETSQLTVKPRFERIVKDASVGMRREGEG